VLKFFGDDALLLKEPIFIKKERIKFGFVLRLKNDEMSMIWGFFGTRWQNAPIWLSEAFVLKVF